MLRATAAATCCYVDDLAADVIAATPLPLMLLYAIAITLLLRHYDAAISPLPCHAADAAAFHCHV